MLTRVRAVEHYLYNKKEVVFRLLLLNHLELDQETFLGLTWV